MGQYFMIYSRSHVRDGFSDHTVEQFLRRQLQVVEQEILSHASKRADELRKRANEAKAKISSSVE